ncbi:MAG TPA: type I secretion system permease/ATPase [Gammaproteobacteria bacterium]|nr:type I secretion system permease/ATPase [Gammaproteobacteria bacterium]HIK69237.1 type I secretion system permease/ATPase [Pseudomonadales bacterium]
MDASSTNADQFLTDELLMSLEQMTRLYQRPHSAQGLAAGLPMADGRMDTSLFVRAAERAGFKASVQQRAIVEIPQQILPCVLLLSEQRACILVGSSETALQLIFPSHSDVAVDCDQDDINQAYTGTCLFFKDDQAGNIGNQGEPSRNHWFFGAMAKSKGLYLEVILASLLVNIFALVTPLFIMNVYDRVVPNHALDTLWVLASGVALVLVFDFLMKSMRGYFIDTAGKRADIMLSANTFERVMNMRIADRPAKVGSFANNLQEFDQFREFFTSTTLITVIDLPFVLLFITLIYGIAGNLALIPLFMIPIIIVIGLLFQKRLQTTIEDIFTESSRKTAMLIETLYSLEAIKVAQAEGAMQSRWEAHNSKLAKMGLRSRLLSLSTLNLTQLGQQVASIGVVIGGVYAISDGTLSVGGLIACTILTGRCLVPMSQVAGILTRYHHSIAAYRTIDAMMSLPTEREPGQKFLHRPKVSSDCQFRDVGFAYPGQDTKALEHVSFHIHAGEKVGIIGRTGSGKSTLHRLMCKFYLPESGSILIGGTDIRQIDPADLRRNINYVPQDVTLTSGTVRDNITFGNALATDADVLKAAELAGIASYLNQHPQGFDLEVGERGQQLSGGQRQGIAIARALLSQASLLLLDEPSNAMDNVTEASFISGLQKYIQDKTLILVTHRSSMLALVDRLIVINLGKVVIDGPREEVLEKLASGSNQQ